MPTFTNISHHLIGAQFRNHRWPSRDFRFVVVFFNYVTCHRHTGFLVLRNENLFRLGVVVLPNDCVCNAIHFPPFDLHNVPTEWRIDIDRRAKWRYIIRNRWTIEISRTRDIHLNMPTWTTEDDSFGTISNKEFIITVVNILFHDYGVINFICTIPRHKLIHRAFLMTRHAYHMSTTWAPGRNFNRTVRVF